MVRHFNLQAQLLVILLLGATVVYANFFPLPPGWPLLVDVLSVFAIVHLVGGYFGFLYKNFSRLPALTAAWAVSSESRRVLSIVREFCVWMAVMFLGLRVSRWSQGWEAGWTMKGVAHYANYIEAALFLLSVSWLLSSRRMLRKLRSLDLTSSRRLLFSYIVLIVGASLVLMLPVSVQEGNQLKLVDAVFTVVSALSVTGLATINVAEVLSLTGQSVVLALMQIGGLGIIVITAGLAVTSLKRMSLNDSLVGRELYDIPDIGNMSEFLTKVTVLTLTLEMIGTIFLYMSLPAGQELRFFHAMFHAVSAFCNAGFSSLPGNLENSPFGPLGLGAVCVLLVIGGTGFPILLELLSRLVPSRRKRRLSANARLTLLIMAVLIVTGTAGIFLLESVGGDPDVGRLSRLWNSLFYALSSRTAGFNVSSVVDLSQTSLLIIMMLMVVGGGPLSTAGGIKTTSLGVLAATAWGTLTGKTGAQFGQRTIPDLTIHRVVTAVAAYMFIASVAIVLLVLTQDIDPWVLTFEVISALSTVGLSLGATPELTNFGKVLVLMLMLMGRIGLVTFVYAGLGRVEPQRYKYPQDKFFVG